ncbi:hypothetical protein V6N13_134329 [Hibiscus sabdariffa]|uniref:DUF4220 domain-containing protein n=1 Tax=Hibiscus sabdariffa TaxID=183260 RepID=A0ABR2R409_9ROSI
MASQLPSQYHCLLFGRQRALAAPVFRHVRPNRRSNSNEELDAMAVPLFIAGALKYMLRIWALRCASPRELKNFFYSPQSTPSSADSSESMKEMSPTDLFGASEKRDFIQDPMITPEVKFLQEVYSAFEDFKPLFSDLPCLISEKFHDEMVYLTRSRTTVEAFNFIKIELEFLYDLLFTKNQTQHRNHAASLIFRCIFFFSVISVLVAFSFLHYKDEYLIIDIAITYMLLLGIVWLESYSFYMHVKSKWTMLRYANHRGKLNKLYLRIVRNTLRRIKSKVGIRKMAQHDLLDFCMKARASIFVPVIMLIDTGNLLQKFSHTKWRPVDIELKEFIYTHLKEKRSDLENRGFELEFVEKMLGEKGDNVIRQKVVPLEDDWKLESRDFIRRIFVWHIATSLVYYDDHFNHRLCACNSIHEIGKSLSDYMMYLVLVRPTMLPNGFSEMVNKRTYEQIRIIFPDTTSMNELLQVLQLSTMDYGITEMSGLPGGLKETGALSDGIKFARQLQSLTRQRWDDKEKWKMISDVWMEMMVYGASRCRWTEHAQQLRHGGELLTHVALLMAHLGLSTHVHTPEIIC